jgi:hypothetical protein
MPGVLAEWLIYLQAHTPAGTPAYAEGLQADHNRPRWRRAR